MCNHPKKVVCKVCGTRYFEEGWCPTCKLREIRAEKAKSRYAVIMRK
jgi:hypothetical protein